MFCWMIDQLWLSVIHFEITEQEKWENEKRVPKIQPDWYLLQAKVYIDTELPTLDWKTREYARKEGLQMAWDIVERDDGAPSPDRSSRRREKGEL